jgi:hypothetical protein
LLAQLLVDRIGSHVSAIIDRTLPRAFELGHDHQLVERLWALETSWLDLTDTVSAVARALDSIGESDGVDDATVAEFVFPTVPQHLDRFFDACEQVAE